MSKQRYSGSGISFPTLLGTAFIILKLTDVIDWSWWWVLAPFWAGLVIVLIIVAIFLIFG